MFYLHFRNELWKLFGKKRTYIGFGAFLVVQTGMLLMFRFGHVRADMERVLAGNGYLAEEYISALTVAVIMLIPQVALLMPLYATLVGGDMVAKEAEDGTLRMILSRPISRVRLLLVKWFAGCIFSALLVVALGVLGLGFASCFFPWGGLFVFVPGELFTILDPGPGINHYIAAHAMMVVKASTLLALSFMFGCFNVKPAAATILALSVTFVSFVLMQIPFFRDLQPWFFTYHLNVWQNLLAEHVPWWRVGESLSILLGFNLTFLAIGLTAFQVRDIKS